MKILQKYVHELVLLERARDMSVIEAGNKLLNSLISKLGSKPISRLPLKRNADMDENMAYGIKLVNILDEVDVADVRDLDMIVEFIVNQPGSGEGWRGKAAIDTGNLYPIKSKSKSKSKKNTEILSLQFSLPEKSLKVHTPEKEAETWRNHGLGKKTEPVMSKATFRGDDMLVQTFKNIFKSYPKDSASYDERIFKAIKNMPCDQILSARRNTFLHEYSHIIDNRTEPMKNVMKDQSTKLIDAMHGAGIDQNNANKLKTKLLFDVDTEISAYFVDGMYSLISDFLDTTAGTQEAAKDFVTSGQDLWKKFTEQLYQAHEDVYDEERNLKKFSSRLVTFWQDFVSKLPKKEQN